MMLRVAARAAAAAPRTALPKALAARQFHAGIPSRAEEKSDEAEDDGVGNDGALGAIFGNPYYSVPIGGLGIMTAHEMGLYHFDAETQLLGLWCMFVGTCYYNFGDQIGAMLDETGAQVKSEQHQQEDAIIAALEVTKEAHSRQTAIFEDINAIHESQKEIMEAIVSAKSSELRHQMRAQVVSRLENVAAEESRFTAGIQAGLVNAATEQVRSAMATKEVKDRALQQAMKQIADPSQALTEDPVGEVYSKVFADFNAKLAATANEEQALSAEAKAEMSEDMKSIARRDGLDFVSVSAPDALKLGSI